MRTYHLSAALRKAREDVDEEKQGRKLFRKSEDKRR